MNDPFMHRTVVGIVERIDYFLCVCVVGGWVTTVRATNSVCVCAVCVCVLHNVIIAMHTHRSYCYY